MRPDVAAPRLGTPLIRVGDLGSTNDLARLLSDAGLAEGTVVVARTQTRGRGRHGRVWTSPPGGLWCSIVLRPARDAGWGRLSLAMAVAAAEAIDAAAGVQSAIRWPNDIVIGGRKVAGILLEAARDAIIVGIGINANVPADALPDALRAASVSLHEVAGRAVDPTGLLDGLLACAASWYALWIAGGPQVMSAWTARDAMRGRRVATGSGGVRVEGIAEGVDADGALRVRLAGGGVHRVVAGDLAFAAPDGQRDTHGQEPIG